MLSPDKLEANRANAQHSTGPRTPEGKSRVSQNALKHGLNSPHVLVREDEREAFKLFDTGLRARILPDGELEESLFLDYDDPFTHPEAEHHKMTSSNQPGPNPVSLQPLIPASFFGISPQSDMVPLPPTVRAPLTPTLPTSVSPVTSVSNSSPLQPARPVP